MLLYKINLNSAIPAYLTYFAYTQWTKAWEVSLKQSQFSGRLANIQLFTSGAFTNLPCNTDHPATSGVRGHVLAIQQYLTPTHALSARIIKQVNSVQRTIGHLIDEA